MTRPPNSAPFGVVCFPNGRLISCFGGSVTPKQVLRVVLRGIALISTKVKFIVAVTVFLAGLGFVFVGGAGPDGERVPTSSGERAPTGAPSPSPASMAGLLTVPVAGAVENASIADQPSGEWIALIQAPFGDGATIVLDWKDENNFVQIRPRVGFGHWTVDQFVDGMPKQLDKLQLSTDSSRTLFVRRTRTHVTVEFKPSVRFDVPLDSADGPDLKVGLAWYGVPTDVPIFDIGSLNVQPGSDTGFLPTPQNFGPSDFTVGPGRYFLQWLPGSKAEPKALIYRPVGPAGQPYPLVVITPGYLGRWSHTTWLAAQLASRGYAVAAVQTTSSYSLPDKRGRDIVDVIDRLTSGDSASSWIDADRVVLMGHSMGAGASLHVASDDRRIAGVVALAPWIDDETKVEVPVPALVISCETDNIAEYTDHTRPVLDALETAPFTAWMEFEGVGHDCPTNQMMDLPIRSTIVEVIVDFLASSLEIDAQADDRLCRSIAESTVLSRFETPSCDDLG